MKSWKTTTAGICAIVAAIATAVDEAGEPGPEQAIDRADGEGDQQQRNGDESRAAVTGRCDLRRGHVVPLLGTRVPGTGTGRTRHWPCATVEATV